MEKYFVNFIFHYATQELRLQYYINYIAELEKDTKYYQS